MKIRGSLLFFGALAAVMAGGVAARADGVTVTANFPSYTNGPGGYYGLSENLYTNYYDVTDGSASSAIGHGTVAGIYEFNSAVVAGSGTDPTYQQVVDSITNGTFQAVCIDMSHNVGWGQPGIQWTVKDLTSVVVADNGVGISSAQAHALQNLWVDHFDASKANNNDAAAFQMAVWDLLYNGPKGTGNYQYSFASPTPTLNYGGVTLGSDWADQAWAEGGDFTTPVYALVCATGTQSFAMTLVPPALTPPPAVPLPASVGLGFSMLAGFGALFGVRKRLSRRPRIA